MTNPKHRDRLGRIVYVGDVLDSGAKVTHIDPDCDILLDARVCKPTPFTVFYAHLVTIDLDASPDHTNYERYFADLGTRADVQNAFFDEPDYLCDGPSCCDTCPFNLITGNCGEFIDWLDEKAVI